MYMKTVGLLSALSKKQIYANKVHSRRTFQLENVEMKFRLQ